MLTRIIAEEGSIGQTSNNRNIGSSVIKGMKDSSQQEKSNFECSKERDFSMDRVKHVLQAVYQTVGKDGMYGPLDSGMGTKETPEGDFRFQFQSTCLHNMRRSMRQSVGSTRVTSGS
jgi:hypothetical protein